MALKSVDDRTKKFLPTRIKVLLAPILILALYILFFEASDYSLNAGNGGNLSTYITHQKILKI